MRLWLFPMMLALAACKGEPPAERPQASASEHSEPLPVMGPERRVLAFGDSLFAGYNLEPGESFPARLEAALRARGVNARVTNAGVSGDTTASGRQRIGFALDQLDGSPDLAIVELGGNDLLRGLDPQQTRANLAAILRELARREIPVLLMGMRAPPNLGADFQESFDSIYPDLAEQYDAALVPFFLEAIYTRPELIQPDRIHPTAEGVETLVLATVDQVTQALPEEEEAAD